MGKQPGNQRPPQLPPQHPVFVLRFFEDRVAWTGTPQILQVYGAMDPFLAYTLAPMHRVAFHIPRVSGKTTWDPTSSSTSTATPCFRAEILGSEPPGTPQIQRVYGAMNPLLAYTLAPIHLSAFYIPRASGKTS